MTKTAVECLKQDIDSELKHGTKMVVNWDMYLQMEKEQIIESYCQGCFDISLNKNIFPRETSEQYYNETFKK
jgi:hypothetical protein